MSSVVRDPRNPLRIALLAPLVFILHVVEEAPGFVPWFNALVTPGITQSLFLSVNAVAFFVTVLLAFSVVLSRNEAIVLCNIAWLSFLMFANALFHITGTIVHGYSPGTVTAVVLYLPLFAGIAWVSGRACHLHPVVMAVATLVGATPMLAHGYLIIFRGSRLF